MISLTPTSKTMTFVPKITVFTPGRTGSQFVYELLKAHLNGAELLEWFSDSFVREREDIPDQEFLSYIHDCIVSPTKPFAIKITPAAFGERWEGNREMIENILSATANTHQILLYRQDFWGACISNWMANRTGVWHSNQQKQETLEVEFADTIDYIKNTEKRLFEAFAKYSTSEHLVIAYESLLTSPITFAHQILRKVAPSQFDFASINLRSTPKKVLDSAQPVYVGQLCELSNDTISYFYREKADRDRYLHKMLSELSQAK
jgi:LPS sulfotransferase NodH